MSGHDQHHGRKAGGATDSCGHALNPGRRRLLGAGVAGAALALGATA